MTRLALVIALFILLCSAWLVPAPSAQAQTAEELWGQPANLSNSGAASEPLFVRQADGALYVFWWDQFDGPTYTQYVDGLWAAPQVAPILMPRRDEKGEVVVDKDTGQPIIEPIKATASLTADGAGRVHALWLGNAPPKSELRPLMYSTLQAGTAQWAEPRAVVESASAWKLVAAPSGALHLLFFYPARTPNGPPGIYAQRSDDGGANWQPRVQLAEAPYARLVSQSSFAIELIADGGSGLFALWDDPRTGESVYTRSGNNGDSWVKPKLVNLGGAAAHNARLALAKGAQLLLWDGDADGQAGLFQQRSRDGGSTWSAPERVLKDLNVSAASVSLARMSDGRVLLLAAGRAGAPVMAAWDPAAATGQEGGTGWSDLKTLGLAGSGGAGTRMPTIRRWRPEVLGTSLSLLGMGVDGDAWLLRRSLKGLSWAFTAPPSFTTQVTATVSTTSDWLGPINLSRSGAAAQPLVVPGAEGKLQAFWWDSFDGLTSAFFDGQAWFRAVGTPLQAASGAARASLPAMPTIVGDGRGRAYALWLGDGAAPDRHPLLASALELGTKAWSAPITLTASALAWETATDAAGRLHLLYVRPADSPEAPAGLYYSYALENGAGWAPPKGVLSSVYMRLWKSEAGRLALAADGQGQLVAAWDDPRQEGLFYATSADAGQTWTTPLAVQSEDRRPAQPHVTALGANAFMLLWQPGAGAVQGELYQQISRDGGATWSAPERALGGISSEGLRLTALPTGQALLIAGEGGGNISLAVWEAAAMQPGASGWSAPQALALAAEDPVTQRPLYLDALRVAVGDKQLAVVGRGQEGEAWALQRDLGTLEWAAAPPPPWSQPVAVSEGAQLRGLATLAADGDGQLHALWSEAGAAGIAGGSLTYARFDGARWSRPAAVLRSPEGRAEQPALAIVGDRLHVVWSGGSGGAIYYSSAFVRDAYAAGSWAEPVALPAPQGALGLANPCLAADPLGDLHVAYVVPLNEGRGVYYTRSQDGGAAWSPAATVFDAGAAGWAMVTQPALAVDADGTAYVAWARAALPEPVTPQGAYVSLSVDHGQTWAQPFKLNEGVYDLPLLALSQPGVLHALWRDASGAGVWWQRVSNDGGNTWSDASQVRGARGLQGRVALTSAWDGTLRLLGVSAEGDEATLFEATWSDAAGQWEPDEGLRLERMKVEAEGVAAALAPLQGRLAALVRAQAVGQGAAPAWLATQRNVAAIAALPVPSQTRAPTPTPAPTLVPTPTPRPVVNVTAPTPGTLGGVIDLGVVRIPWMMIGGVALAALLLATVLVVRGGRRR